MEDRRFLQGVTKLISKKEALTNNLLESPNKKQQEVTKT